MLFNSTDFFIFFPLIVGIYFLLPYRSRVWFLLAASYFFYASWKVEYLGLILFSTVTDYFAGLKIAAHSEKKKKQFWLRLSICANLGLLLLFKYFNFFADNVTDLAALFGLNYAAPFLNLLLPIGISFYTFQSMSYSIDIYHGRVQIERNFPVFALYVSFFPQLVAGPIERASSLIPQFRQHFDFEYERVIGGLKKMLWGFFKKLVIADNLAPIVNLVYDSPESFSGFWLLFATYLFAFQIYCDFSGYSDIAIGAAAILGIRLMENFKLPYFAHSIPAFWERWHISLSSWFRDYVYLPLGGNRVGRERWFFNIAAVFIISGFWHGANWTFIAWGGVHAVFYLAYRRFGSKFGASKTQQSKLKNLCSVFFTFQIVTLAWIFFRATNIWDAFFIIKNIFTNFSSSLGTDLLLKNFGRGLLIVTVGQLLFFMLADSKITSIVTGKRLVSNKVNHLIFGSLIAAIFLFGNFGKVDFIYFQF